MSSLCIYKSSVEFRPVCVSSNVSILYTKPCRGASCPTDGRNVLCGSHIVSRLVSQSWFSNYCQCTMVNNVLTSVYAINSSRAWSWMSFSRFMSLQLPLQLPLANQPFLFKSPGQQVIPYSHSAASDRLIGFH